ncbi:hypothetical protein GF382_02615 [Candidatus Falkowbacteria bacterium]|nr:hypothetical protein [Candidatus Falkowbacteria bacterium]
MKTMRKKTLLKLLTILFIVGLVLPVQNAWAVAADTIKFDDGGTVEAAEEISVETPLAKKTHEDFSIYLDKETIAKGYTVSPFSGNLKLSLVPGILDQDTRVDCEEITDEMPMPWSLEKISKIYQFEFRNKSAYDNHKPFYIQFSYDKASDDYKRVFFYDKNYGTWRELPTRDYPEEKFVRSLIHLPYARIVVLADNSRMSGGNASWYAYKGGNFAASPDFPKGSRLRVFNTENEKFVDITVNDYGPDRALHPDRVIDLDKVAFSKIAPIGAGIINVSIKPLYVVPDSQGRVLGISERGVGPAPELKARAAIVVNEETGEVIMEKDSKKVLPLASLSKLVAIKVFMETKTSLEKEVAYDEQDELYNYEYCKPWESAKLRLKAGEVVTVKDLIYASLVSSANNAVESLVRASGIGRDEFIKRMNEAVKKWGALNTRFVEPSGLSWDNVTTAYDYAIITKEVFKDPVISQASIASKYEFSTINTGRDFRFSNTNNFIRDDLFARTNNLKITGSKTGYLNEALYCLMTRATGPNGQKVIVVDLGSETKTESLEEVKELIRYGLSLSK